jgi:hypothetical protein
VSCSFLPIEINYLLFQTFVVVRMLYAFFWVNSLVSEFYMTTLRSTPSVPAS